MAIEGLPEDLTALILSKLPVVTLLRCKCVRKSWYSLIKSPQFIRLHLTTRSSSSSSSSSTSSKNYDCFIVRRCIEHPRHVLSFYSHETLDDLGNDIDIPISTTTCPYTGDVSLSGHCDGLVCITNFNGQVLICNPATREFRSLFVPHSFTRRSGPSSRNFSGYVIESVAFGSDPNTGEYKVVMIVVPYDNRHLYGPSKKMYCGEQRRDNCEVHVYEFLVYDFKTNSWRETAIFPGGAFRHSRHRAVSLNGAFHWSPWDDSILRFRFSDEVAETIPLPDFFVDVSQQRELCVSSKSQLSLILYDDCIDLEGRFEVCVMTEYGVKESWTRLFKIGPLLDICYPLALLDDQQLLLGTSEEQLVSYDLQHQNIRHFPIYGAFDLYPYSESLVSVKGIGK